MNDFIGKIRFGSVATYALITINLVVFIAISLLRFNFGSEEGELADVGGGSALSLVLSGEYWRLITSNYLHLGIFHFGMNMFALYYYGSFIESYFEGKRTFIIYTLTGITSALLALTDFNTITLGASGAVWGLIGVMIGNSLRKNTYSPGLPISWREMLPSLLFWLFIGRLIPGISFLGHVGGFLGGIALGFILNTENNFDPKTFESTFVKYGFWFCVVISIMSYVGLISYVLA